MSEVGSTGAGPVHGLIASDRVEGTNVYRPNGDKIGHIERIMIDKKTGPFHPQEFHDRYVDALKDLIERKRKSKSGKKIIEDKDDGGGRGGSNVVDLMAALKKSLDKPAAKPAAKTAPAKKTAAKKSA